MSWTIEDLRRLDLQYAQQGVPMHARPFRAATDLLGRNFSMGPGGNPRVREITAAYEAEFPETRASWLGMGVGLAASVDQVRRAVMPVAFGTVPLEPWQALGFSNKAEWWHWCREDRDIAAETCFAFADLLDFSYGVDELQGTRQNAQTLWRMAASNLADAASTLPTAFSVDAVLQPICMVAELSLKAALVFNGADTDAIRREFGHNLAGLAERLSREPPHRDDPLLQSAIATFPRYVASRYAPAGLTRLHVVRLALAAQFVAASTVRRLTDRDVAAQFEAAEWPGQRRPFFT